jgi:hypothetical protein
VPAGRGAAGRRGERAVRRVRLDNDRLDVSKANVFEFRSIPNRK